MHVLLRIAKQILEQKRLFRKTCEQSVFEKLTAPYEFSLLYDRWSESHSQEHLQPEEACNEEAQHHCVWYPGHCRSFVQREPSFPFLWQITVLPWSTSYPQCYSSSTELQCCGDMWTMMHTEKNENTIRMKMRVTSKESSLQSPNIPFVSGSKEVTMAEHCSQWDPLAKLLNFRLKGTNDTWVHLLLPSKFTIRRFPLPGMTSSGTKYRAGYGPHASGNDNPWQVFQCFSSLQNNNLRLLDYIVCIFI